MFRFSVHYFIVIITLDIILETYLESGGVAAKGVGWWGLGLSPAQRPK